MKNVLIIEKNGSKQYYLNNELHRVDGPAQEVANGTKYWFLYGKRHRVDGPAIEREDGSKFWWLNGKKHRVDGPAEEWANGARRWFLHGELHRVDGPAQELEDGSKFWFLYGKQVERPNKFKNMEAWFEKLNTDEKYSLLFIHKFNGLIEVIKNPTDKQKRLHAMKWKL